MRVALREKGSSLVEMMVVLVVIAIVTTLAIIQFSSPKKQFARQNVSRELKTALERARFDSVKRRASVQTAQARVIINSTSFTLATDRDQNGAIQTADNLVNSFGGQNISITGSGMVFPVTVFYNHRGEVIALDNTGAQVSPVFRICLGDCSTPNNANSDLLIVTPTGTVNLLSGSSSVPTFASPSVSAIGGGTDVEPLVIVP